MKAMLYEEISDPAKVRALLDDPSIVAEQKMDGMRVLSHWTGEGFEFAQRGGGPIGFHAGKQHLMKLEQALWPVFHRHEVKPNRLVLDGELMIGTGEYRVFDLIDPDFLSQSYWSRRDALEFLIDRPLEMVEVVEMARSTREKDALLHRVLEGGGEGVMLKHLDKGYEPGKKVKHSVKVKFVKAADMIILEVNRPDPKHGSASLGVWDHSSGRILNVGACSLIGKPVVKPGDVVEINYLYWTGSSIYQPRMTRVRPDKDAWECSIDQFQPYSRDVL